jgi:hypothetical protein
MRIVLSRLPPTLKTEVIDYFLRDLEFCALEGSNVTQLKSLVAGLVVPVTSDIGSYLEPRQNEPATQAVQDHGDGPASATNDQDAPLGGNQSGSAVGFGQSSSGNPPPTTQQTITHTNLNTFSLIILPHFKILHMDASETTHFFPFSPSQDIKWSSDFAPNIDKFRNSILERTIRVQSSNESMTSTASVPSLITTSSGDQSSVSPDSSIDLHSVMAQRHTLFSSSPITRPRKTAKSSTPSYRIQATCHTHIGSG